MNQCTFYDQVASKSTNSVLSATTSFKVQKQITVNTDTWWICSFQTVRVGVPLVPGSRKLCTHSNIRGKLFWYYRRLYELFLEGCRFFFFFLFYSALFMKNIIHTCKNSYLIDTCRLRKHFSSSCKITSCCSAQQIQIDGYS